MNPPAPAPPNDAPILVTGSHRSGSTWVGRLLSAAPGVGYVHEPFNPLTGRGTCGVPVERWFTYVCDENAGPWKPALARTLAFDYAWGAALRGARGPRDLARAALEARAFARLRRSGARPLVKDPIAFFSADWLARTFGMRVVLLVRHPLAFVGSLKKHDWRFPFDHLASQPLLLRDLLGPFADEIHAHAAREADVVDQAVLLWRLIHHVALGYRERHPDWLLVRYEDLAADPLMGFQALCTALAVPFEPQVRASVRHHSAEGNPADPADPHALRRDSRASLATWRHRLTPAEAERVTAGTAAIARHFYPEGEG